MVLAAPAIAALQRRFPDPILYCHPRTLPLARHLFPDLRCRTVTLSHLDKDRRLPHSLNPLTALTDELDLLISLRWDATIDRLLNESAVDFVTSGEEGFETHVAVEQCRVVAPFTGWYDLLESYHYELLAPQQPTPRKIGLCISAGHSLNAWPLNHWLNLGERLHQRGYEIAVIGGPAEAARVRVLREALAGILGHEPVSMIGSDDFETFLQRVVHETDLIIATDSGTAHLASLVRPVISLFGGTPWRRYAPLGSANVVISKLEPCSPCRQFDRMSILTCHSQECLVNLSPRAVVRCLERYLADELRVGVTREQDVWMLRAPWQEHRVDHTRSLAIT
jgi:heptosyltransferase-2